MLLSPFRSNIPGLRWPSLPGPQGAEILAMQYQFARSERWPAEAVQARQFRQIEVLAAHADQTMPFWRNRLRSAGIRRGRPFTPQLFSKLPPLTRAEIQAAGDAAFCPDTPTGHGGTRVDTTSGSQGVPLRVRQSDLFLSLTDAFHMRNALWHSVATTEKYAQIRMKSLSPTVNTAGSTDPDWGSSFTALFHTGPTVNLDIRTPTERQAEWLVAEQPGYIQTNPSNIALLARHFRRSGQKLERLRSFLGIGEAISEDTLALCRDVFGVGIIDIYSGKEPGVIALQCPEHGSYHVMSEGLLVEILDQNDRPCEPGEIGRVIVTPLHNYAMPLLRYDIGDLAEVGTPCACGRTLPVLSRLLGRVRDIVHLPGGETRFAHIASAKTSESRVIIQFRVAQVALDRLEFRLRAQRELTQEERDVVTTNLRSGLDYPFQVDFVYVDEFPRSPGGKFHDFVSELLVT